MVEQFIRLLVIGVAVTASLYSQQADLPLLGANSTRDLACYRGLLHPGRSPFVLGPTQRGFEHFSFARFPAWFRLPDGLAASSLWHSPFSSFQQANVNFSTWDFSDSRKESQFVTAENDEAAGSLGLAMCDAEQRPEEPSSSPATQSSTTDSSPKHLFYVVPAYNVAYSKKFKPLTPRQKFHEWLEGTYDPRGLGLEAAEAATLEHSSRDGFCGYGHGGGDYLKCYGSMNLDLTISSFFGDALFPVLMHEDPRYFRLGQGSTARRVGYAVSRVFVTHADSGHFTFEAAALSGSVLAAAVSTLYYPRSDRGFGHSVNRFGIDLADTAAFNVAAEYWPNIQHLLHRMRHIF